jgi:hypothetical protein
MIDKAVDHAPRACAHIVWHVHVLRMFTEREQDELVNKTAKQYLPERCTTCTRCSRSTNRCSRCTICTSCARVRTICLAFAKQ